MDGYKQCNAGSGYLCIYVDGKRVLSHRYVWSKAFGSIPNGMEIDHINGVRDDNRLENLRCVTRQQNAYNRANVKGYSWHKHKGKYLAQIMYNGKNLYLGYHDNVIDAHAAYLKKYNQINGEHFNGRI